MDKKTLLDLKDGLRAVRREAEDKLNAHGVRDDPDDRPVYDRSKRNRRDRYDRWLGDMAKRGWEDD